MGSPIPGTSARHWRFSKGNNSSGPSTGLSTSVSPMARPAHHWGLTLFVLEPSSNHRMNRTSSSRMQPLILVNTSVLVTVSLQNMASSRAGAATEASV